MRIDNDPVALSLEIAKAGQDPEVVLKATYGWYWAGDVLTAAGARVHLAHPLRVKQFTYRRVKNDEPPTHGYTRLDLRLSTVGTPAPSVTCLKSFYGWLLW